MNGAGRPLRFLVAALGGWTVMRIAILWPSIDSLPTLVRALAPPVAAATRRPDTEPAASPEPVVPRNDGHRPSSPKRTVRADLTVSSPSSGPRHFATPPTIAAAVSSLAPPRQPPPLRPVPLAAPPRRLAGSAWLIARNGRADALAGGQLGASQAGARITYTLAGRVALAGRVSAPLEGRGAEAAIGFDWQPATAPVHLVAEQRFAIDGGRGGTALLVIGGLDPTPVALGFSIDAYAQAGGIQRRGGVIGFADGAARLARPVLRRGTVRIELGAGAWGGVQPGAARFDLGPSAALVVPVGGRAVRLSLDWRQRVAGRARPGSGPAVSIGSDF